ncbi:hypothetical protein KP509_17G013300 [Ceratopteris richardii]|uniref:EF-hand domain-containing protein n=2 Tax=Ceratopteris richardii TaxID=49495 RepID=A0A8T2SU54_CERRI|nr:hypothetical protein KP509_17G013300 [Ceratopteris richardii]KAH7372618.1 hypothetical protein KP509_17G013300 [Ceratopteris richardii]KAH7372619.1 hypothetical protein KP509_17G013300 [Ceratopteris richardii]KAH7372620.1 hypothetical protein KP509_17G013300 [Ceratopteris richardii]
MGCFSSKPSKLFLGCNNPADLALGTSFSVNEVEALYELFKQISSSVIKDGLIHKEEFQLALSENTKRQNFFAERIFDMFDSKKDGVLEFGEFVKGLSVFHPNTPEEEKIDFAFELYDFNQMGHIGREEVKLMLIAILSESDTDLSDDVIEAILEKTFVDADTNRDGKIDRDDWKDFVCRNPAMIKMMTLPYLKEITTTFPSFIFHSKVDDLST